MGHPDILSKEDKFTFHVFRISVLGFYIKDMGFTLYEAQTISRHKIGSSTTEEVYLAKGKFAFAQSLASKIQDFIRETGEMPVARSDEDSISLQAENNLLLYTDSARLAKRYKSFAEPKPKPRLTPRTSSHTPCDTKNSGPTVGDIFSFPYKVGSEIVLFEGTLVKEISRNNSQGFLVKFSDSTDLEFIPLPSIMEVANK